MTINKIYCFIQNLLFYSISLFEVPATIVIIAHGEWTSLRENITADKANAFLW